MAFPPTTCWGNPLSEKRALLLHGLTSASPSFFRVAGLLAEQGYYVVAPDLSSHGLAPRPPSGTVASFASALLPLVAAPPKPWAVMVGHSLGGLVALQLFPRVAGPLPRLVLVDPPLEMSTEERQAVLDGTLADFAAPKTAKEYMDGNPRWTEKDAVIKVYGEAVCDRGGVAAILEDNDPWSFTHLIPPSSSGTEVIILGAQNDPAFSPAEVSALAQVRPDVKTFVVPYTSHSIHREDPAAVVAWILDGKAAA